MALAPQEHGLGHPYVPPKPKAPLQNPFHIANIYGQDVVNPVAQGVAAPPPPPAPEPPPPPPPPPDWNALVNADQGYKDSMSDLQRQNKLSTDALAFAFGRNKQSSYDAYNAHGGLFSGAAANAQKSIAAANEQANLQQALNYDQGGHNIYSSVFQRLVQQLAGGQ